MASMDRRLLMGLLACAAARPAGAQQQQGLRIFAAGATKAIVEDLAPHFEHEAGIKIAPAFDTVGALRDRVIAGEAPDVVLLSTPAIEAIAEKRGKPAGRVTLGRTGVGLAAPKGRASPPIDTPERLRAYLLSAGTIGYADPARGATAGTQFRKAVEALGLQDPLKDKLKVFPFGVEVIAALGRNELDVGVSQATEIVTNDKVAFIGFLPDALQLWTVYEAAILRDGDSARKFLAALSTPAGVGALKKSGFEPVSK